ncbi:hypothetical protein D918_01743 [Trichuris suis]|nr:hypothetical protein D918_01743 [Trichuris suis]
MEKATVGETAVSYSVGERVECEYRRQWYKATITGQMKRRGNQLYRVHYVGWGAEWDESVPASRLRKAPPKRSTGDKVPPVEDPIARLKERLKTCVAARGTGIPKLNEPMITGKKRRPRRACNVQDEKTPKASGKHCRERKDSIVHAKKTSSADDAMDKRLIPEGLVDVLRDDHRWVTKDLYIPNIPAFPNVTQILSKFCNSASALKPDDVEKRKYCLFLKHMKSLFNKCLPLQLLYRFERFQLEEIMRTMPQIPYCDIYGFPHLVRFCFSLRDILKWAKVTKSEVEVILPVLLEFFTFLKKRKRLLTLDNYATVLPSHIREVYDD